MNEIYFYLICRITISGKKLPEYPAVEEEVLQLAESVADARRIAHMV